MTSSVLAEQRDSSVGDRHIDVLNVANETGWWLCRRGLLLVRGVFGFGAIGNYLFAVSLLPLNDTLVLTFTAPIWAAVLGPCLIKEKPTK